VQAVVHLWWWVAAVKIPAQATLGAIASNLLRDAVFDGVLVAVAIMLVSAVIMWGLRARQGTVALALAALVVLLGLPLAVAAPSRDSARLPMASDAVAAGYNVVLISIDSLRADHMSVYGYPRPTTPQLEALARDGVVFERCSSTTSWTLPAHMSLLTGRSLLGHGVVGDDRRLSAEVPTLAGAMSAAGYATAAVVSAPYVESRFGFDHGFDHYDDETVSFATNNESYKSVTAGLVNDAAEQWISANRDRRFFLFLHYWDVHYDYAPGSPYDKMFDPDYAGDVSGENFYFNDAVNSHMDRADLDHVVALYDGEIRLVDDHIGGIRQMLQRQGLSGRTLIVVTADHGEEFFDHGRKGHHRTLYEEVLHVPLIIYVPGLEVASPRLATEASIIDIMPTVLSLTGVAAPPGLEGLDFSRAISAGDSTPTREIVAELYRKRSLNVQVALRRNDEKIIHHFNHRLLQSYDLRVDAVESDERGLAASTTTDLTESMAQWLNQRWRLFSRRIRVEGVESSELDQSTQEALRSLGYIQ